jgi:hypothetical protein
MNKYILSSSGRKSRLCGGLRVAVAACEVKDSAIPYNYCKVENWMIK